MHFLKEMKSLAYRFASGGVCLLLTAQPLYAFSSPLSSSAYAAQETQEESVTTLLGNGAKLYREGKWAEAIQIWKQVLAIEPDNKKAERYIERAQEKLSRNGEMATTETGVTAPPTPVVELKPEMKEPEKDADTLLKEGILFYREGKHKEAIQVWNKALAKDPNNEKIKRYIERAMKKDVERTPLSEAEIMVEQAKEKPKATPKKEIVAKKETEPAKPIPIKIPVAESPVFKKETKQTLPYAPESLPIQSVGAPIFAEGEIHDYGVLNLHEIVKLGLGNHGPSKVAREEIRLAKMRLIEARRAAYPGVNLKNGIIEGTSTDEPFEGLEFTAEFQMPIMSGGRIKNAIRQAEANVAVAVKNYEKIRADFVAELEQAYYALSNAKKVYRDRIQLDKEAQWVLNLTRKQFEAKLARQLDLLSVESQFNDISLQLTSAEKDLELAYLTLKQSMDLQENEIFDVEELNTYTIMDIGYDQTLALALKRRPDIRLSELQVLFNKYAVKVAESQDKFRVEMNASVGLNDQAFVETEPLELETEFFVGIRATKPLGMHTIDNNFIVQDRVPAAGQTTSSQFGSNTMTLQLFNNTAKTGVAEARIQYMRAEGELKNAIKTTRFEVRQNFFEYQKSMLQLEGAITRLKLGEEEVKILKAQAQLNQAQLIDVLRAQVRQYEARGNLAQSVTSYYTSTSNLNKAIGITGYFNPVTGETSEQLHKELFKPINKPRYKVFTQLTKDKLGEDILALAPEEVTAETLLAKERRRELSFNDKWVVLAPLKIIPGATEVFTPQETQTGLLKGIQLPPEKPLPPFKPWQFLRWPMLGLMEYETILDAVEADQAKPKPAPKTEH